MEKLTNRATILVKQQQWIFIITRKHSINTTHKPVRQENPCGYGVSLGISVTAGPLFYLPQSQL